MKRTNKGIKCSIAATKLWARRSTKEIAEISAKISASKKKYHATEEGKAKTAEQGRKHSKKMRSGLFKKTGLANLSDEARERGRVTNVKRGAVKRKSKADPSYGAERISASLRGRPMSLPEEQTKDILALMDLPYEYVGDGRLMIGRRCPDFCRVDAKALIEVFGYTHKRKDGKMKAADKRRLEYIESQGFTILVVWQEELRHISTVAAKIKAFDEKVLRKLIGTKKQAINFPAFV